MIYYFLLNGPSKSGKSTSAREAVRWFTTRGIKANYESLAGPMKQFMATLLGQAYSSLDKDYPNPLLESSIREALIDLSEHYLKVRYGSDFFGRALVHRWIKTSVTPTPVVLVVDDCGFEDEYNPIANQCSCLVRVLRPHYNFVRDSRHYIPSPDRLLINDGTINDLYTKVDDLVDYAITRWNLKPSIYTDEKEIVGSDEES